MEAPREIEDNWDICRGLVASMPGSAEFMIERDELDLNHSSVEPFKSRVLENGIELRKTLDDGLIKSHSP